MAFDGIVTKSIISELNSYIIGGKIKKIYQPDKDNILIGVYNNHNNYALNLSINANNYRINITTKIKQNPSTAPSFCMLLRKYLLGSNIISIESFDLERIVEFTLLCYNQQGEKVNYKLIIELMGKHSNIILLDENNIIIDGLKHIQNSIRTIFPAKKYLYPTSKKLPFIKLIDFDEFFSMVSSSDVYTIDKLLSDLFIGISISFIQHILDKLEIKQIDRQNLEKIYNYIKNIINSIGSDTLSCIKCNKNDFTIDFKQKENKLQINFFIDDYYYVKEEQELFKNYKNSILKLILNNVKKLSTRLINIDKKLEECKDMDKYKLYGELLTTNLYKLKELNLSEIHLENYYDNNKLLTIPLDSSISVNRNIEKYFKKYNKLKKTIQTVTEQKKETAKELYYLQSIVYELEKANNIQDIDGIYTEITESTNFIKKKKQNKTIKTDLHLNNILDFDIEGYKVLVGKNNKQNDYITFKLASPNDIWFHVKDIPGSHVILKTQGKTIQDNILLKCAKLAAEHSKAKESTSIQVDYTFRKNVKKQNKSKPGMVYYSNYKTIIVKQIQ